MARVHSHSHQGATTVNMDRCDVCDRVFSYKTNLLAHKRVAHNGRRFQCTKCIRFFQSKAYKEIHMEKVHGIKKIETLKDFKCQECKKAYVRPRDLEAHVIAEHSDKTFACDYCNQEFKRKRVLQNHINRRHHQLTFNYEEILKQGKSLLHHIESRNLPMDVLQEEDLHAVMLYKEYRDKMKKIYE